MEQPNNLEFDIALEIQNKAYLALNEAIMNIVQNETKSFPNSPLMIPTLCLAALCQYVNTYIESFPENMKANIIAMAYQTIGFCTIDDPNNLATMEVAGHA